VIGLRNTFRILLWMLIIMGLWGALSVSYTTVTGAAPCPSFSSIPICYLVSIGYLSMLTAQLSVFDRWKHRLFYPAWALVFIIAVSGTFLEFSVGDTCPRNDGGVPLCYVSLALSLAVFILNTSLLRHCESTNSACPKGPL
jgi:hypothetical protein